MLLIYIGAFRLPNYDAAAARVINNAKAFRECGVTVKFISWGGKYRESDKCLDARYNIDGFEYIITHELDINDKFIKKLGNKLCRGNKTFALLESMSTKPDVIIMYNAGYRQTQQMLKFTKKYNIRLVNDITEWFAPNELYLTDLFPNYLNMHYLQKRIKNKIVISEYLNNYYCKGHNIVIPPLCDKDESKWSVSIKEDIKKYGGTTLIYAGSPGKKDCLHTVINTVQRLIEEGIEIRFLILGMKRESYIYKYAHLLDTTELSDKIMFLGLISQDLVPAYYKIADFMVLLRKPTLKSIAGFPTKFVESMISGIPVITNLTSDLGKYLKDGYNGFVVDGYSAKALYSTIKNRVLLLSDNDYQTMKNNTKNSNQVFDYHYYIKAFKHFIDNLE